MIYSICLRRLRRESYRRRRVVVEEVEGFKGGLGRSRDGRGSRGEGKGMEGGGCWSRGLGILV